MTLTSSPCQDQKLAQPLIVQLGTELADHFGQTELSLRFHGGRLDADQELIAHGSRVFDLMLAFLTQRSSYQRTDRA